VSRLTGREKSERIEGFIPLLGAVNDPVVRNDAAQRIADAFRLEFDAVWQRVKGGRGAQRAPETAHVARAPGATAEKTLLALALQGKLSESMAGRLREELFEEPGCRTLFSIIKNDLQESNPIDFTAIATQLRGEAELTLLSELSLAEEFDDAVLGRMDESLQPLERRYIDRRLMQIQRDISDAQKLGDDGRVDELFAEKQSLTRMLNTMK
ncbi:MAG TPA: DnaB-like helicase N-terminal domain-containing protein, partial [Thermoanaerobaculia bacterium]|nr:DnaB-like helicase N-terminal domain-containing protein [Thermoanaerobaculia bacterium]